MSTLQDSPPPSTPPPLTTELASMLTNVLDTPSTFTAAASNVATPPATPKGSADVRKGKVSFEKGSLYLGLPEQTVRARISWENTRSGNIMVDKLSTEGNASKELELMAVAEISSANFFLTADAGYKHTHFPDGTTNKFAEVKASCVLSAPRFEPWRKDFQNVLATLRWIEEQRATAGNDRQGLFKDTKQKTMPKIIHRLFEKRDKLTKEETEDLLEAESEDSDMTLKWPVAPENVEHLEAIKETHCAMPIPAYNLRNDLIDPKDYQRELAGALVECYFTITHWNIQNKKMDIFNANLKMIKMLESPRPPPSSPRKRLIFGGGGELPSKRLRG